MWDRGGRELKQVLDFIYNATNQNVILVVSNVLLVAANILLAFFSSRNLKMLKIHSSPKPFLKPEIEGLEPDFAPKLKITNYGPGHAVNVKVFVTADTELGKNDIREFKLSGPDFIPITGDTNYGIYKYSEEESIVIIDDMKVTITYESDSGYKRKSEWKRTKSNISNEMMKNEEFVIIKSK